MPRPENFGSNILFIYLALTRINNGEKNPNKGRSDAHLSITRGW